MDCIEEKNWLEDATFQLGNGCAEDRVKMADDDESATA